MFLIHNNEIWDAELGLLQEISEHLDARLNEIMSYSIPDEQADMFGVFDRAEHLLGLGIMAFQNYVTDTASCVKMHKHETYFCGPRTQSGVSKIQIVNAVANYWKHREEWILGGSEKRKAAVNRMFEEAGCSVDMDYPIFGVLTVLLSPAKLSFKNTVPVIIEWRDQLIEYSQKQEDI